MSAERITDVEYEVTPTYIDVQRLVALLNGSADYGAPVRLTDYRGDQYGQYVQSDEEIAQFLGAAGAPVFDIKESGIDGSAPASFSDTLDVGGAATLADTLDVAGAVALAGTLDVGSTATLAAALSVAGNTTIGGTLGVTGASALAGLTATTIHGTGAADFDSTLNADGNTTIGGTLTVDGAGDFNATLNVDGNLTIGGTLDATGAATVAAVTASGAAVFDGSVRFNGDVGFGVAPAALPGSWTQPAYTVDDDIAARTATANAGAIGSASSLANAADLSDTQAMRTVVNDIRADQTAIFNALNTLVGQLLAVGIIK